MVFALVVALEIDVKPLARNVAAKVCSWKIRNKRSFATSIVCFSRGKFFGCIVPKDYTKLRDIAAWGCFRIIRDGRSHL